MVLSEPAARVSAGASFVLLPAVITHSRPHTYPPPPSLCVLPICVIPFRVLPICVMPFCVTPFRVIPLCAIPISVMPVCVMPFRVMSFCVMPFRVMPICVMTFTSMPFCILTICIIPETGVGPSASDRCIHDLEITMSITEDCILS